MAMYVVCAIYAGLLLIVGTAALFVAGARVKGVASLLLFGVFGISTVILAM